MQRVPRRLLGFVGSRRALLPGLRLLHSVFGVPRQLAADHFGGRHLRGVLPSVRMSTLFTRLLLVIPLRLLESMERFRWPVDSKDRNY